MKRTITLCIALALLVATSSLVAASDHKWIVRGNYVKTWPSTDSYQTESVIGDDSIFNELSLDSGQGFGLDIEYKVKPTLGVLVSAIFTDMEGTFVYGLEPGEYSLEGESQFLRTYLDARGAQLIFSDGYTYVYEL